MDKHFADLLSRPPLPQIETALYEINIHTLIQSRLPAGQSRFQAGWSQFQKGQHGFQVGRS